MSFKSDNPHFPNPKSAQKSKVYFSKGKNDVDNFNHWFKQRGKIFQSKEFSQAQVEEAYDNYLCESANGSTSSQEKLSKPWKWKEVKPNSKVESFRVKW